MSLVIVSGWPAAGKTTLAAALAGPLEAALLAKDEIKEALFDSLGTGDRAWSRQLSDAAYAVMFRLAARRLERGLATIVEGNFERARHAARLEELVALGAGRALEVFCHAPPALLLARSRARLGGARHAGHDDAGLLAELEALYAGGVQSPLGVAREVIAVDTADTCVTLGEHVEKIVRRVAAMPPIATGKGNR